MKLWLLRHGAPEVPPGTCYGRLDILVDGQATQAAAQAFHALAQAQGLPVFSSPLRRCSALAQALCGLQPGRRWQPDPRLAELDFGAWEGQPWAAIAPSEISAWANDFTDARPGGHGETVREFMGRVGAALDGWRAQGQDALWVTHSGVIRAAMLRWRGVALPASAAEWPAEAPAFGQWLCLDTEPAPPAPPAAAELKSTGAQAPHWGEGLVPVTSRVDPCMAFA